MPRPSPLWSLAALEEQSSVMFYVPGLLPPVSPQRGHKLTKKTTLSKMVIQNENAPTKLNDQAEDSLKTSRGRNLEGPKESVVVKKMCVTENDECQEITPSQAVDVEMLMELAEEDDICNTSVDSQHMMAASGFCVDEQEEFKVNNFIIILCLLFSSFNFPHTFDSYKHLCDQKVIRDGFLPGILILIAFDWSPGNWLLRVRQSYSVARVW